MLQDLEVAPYAGAWIETSQEAASKLIEPVAPYAGAWIETSVALRGMQHCPVAPYAGAWIETYRLPRATLTGRQSHPTRVADM